MILTQGRFLQLFIPTFYQQWLALFFLKLFGFVAPLKPWYCRVWGFFSEGHTKDSSAIWKNTILISSPSPSDTEWIKANLWRHLILGPNGMPGPDMRYTPAKAMATIGWRGWVSRNEGSFNVLVADHHKIIGTSKETVSFLSGKWKPSSLYSRMTPIEGLIMTPFTVASCYK